MKERLQVLLWPLLGLAVGLLVFGVQPRVHALPEYTTRTGESCATCHVNPAGGGPRTARGALWLAQGKPDRVPELSANADAGAAGLAPDKEVPEKAASASGKVLYEKLGCADCHGAAGEGAFATALNVHAPLKGAEKAIRDGQGTMQAYDSDILSDADLASLVLFVQELAGEVMEGAVAAPRPLGPPASACGGVAGGSSIARSCGGN